MNRDDLLDEIKDVLDANPTQTAQAFTDALIIRTLDRVYKHEVSMAKQHSSRIYFGEVTDVTWPASQLRLTLPGSVSQKDLISLRDVTDSVGGVELRVAIKAGDGLGWHDRNTLQWGLVGPSAARTIRFQYYAVAAKLDTEEAVPELIPEEQHALLVWATAVELREMVDEMAPQPWLVKQQEYRHELWKIVAKGRPNDDPRWIEPRVADSLIY